MRFARPEQSNVPLYASLKHSDNNNKNLHGADDEIYRLIDDQERSSPVNPPQLSAINGSTSNYIRVYRDCIKSSLCFASNAYCSMFSVVSTNISSQRVWCALIDRTSIAQFKTAGIFARLKLR